MTRPSDDDPLALARPIPERPATDPQKIAQRVARGDFFCIHLIDNCAAQADAAGAPDTFHQLYREARTMIMRTLICPFQKECQARERALEKGGKPAVDFTVQPRLF